MVDLVTKKQNVTRKYKIPVITGHNFLRYTVTLLLHYHKSIVELLFIFIYSSMYLIRCEIS